MLQATVRRIAGFTHENIELAKTSMVVCNEDHRFLVAVQIKTWVRGRFHHSGTIGRNTAPALTVCRAQRNKKRPRSVIACYACRSCNRGYRCFSQALTTGIQPALSGAIVTFGIIPDAGNGLWLYTSNRQAP